MTVVVGTRLRAPGVTSLRASDAQLTAGIERDALKVTQALPGVAPASLGSSGLTVWGAPPAATRVEVDGIEVPALFHLGGYRSVVPSGLVSRFELEPAPSRLDLGRGLGGAVRVELRGVEDGLHGELATDLSDTGAQLSWGSPEGGALVAGRISTLRAVLGPALAGVAQDRYALPTSWDAQLKAQARPSGRDELSLTGLVSSDQLSASISSDDPSLARGRVEVLGVQRVGVSWRRGDETEGGRLTVWAGHDEHQQAQQTPFAQASLDAERWSAGARAKWQGRMTDWLSGQVGLDALLTRTALARVGALTVPAREGDLTAFGAPLPDVLTADRWRVTAVDAAVFFGGDVALGPVHVLGGLRLAAVSADVSRATPRVASTPAVGLSTLELAVDPRVQASWAVTRVVTVSASAGLAHQAPDAADLSAVFGTPGLTPAHGGHVAVSAVVEPHRLVSAELTGFWRTAWGLAERAVDPKLPPAQLLAPTGTQRAGGASLSLRQRPWNGWTNALTYTLSRAERRASPDAPWVVLDEDRPHALALTSAWSSSGWRVAARLRWATGLPRTPVVGSVQELRRGVFVPVFGAQNTARLPDFVQLDLEAARSFRLGPVALEVYLEVLNVTNHRNVEDWVYDSRFLRRDELLGLPIFGTVGLRGGF